MSKTEEPQIFNRVSFGKTMYQKDVIEILKGLMMEEYPYINEYGVDNKTLLDPDKWLCNGRNMAVSEQNAKIQAVIDRLKAKADERDK